MKHKTIIRKISIKTLDTKKEGEKRGWYKLKGGVIHCDYTSVVPYY